ncbi:hypothetical protein D3C87_1784050 [compost metagenome]
MHRFGGPLFRLTIQLVDLVLTIHIAAEIRQHLIVIAKVNQRIHQIAVAARLVRVKQAGGDLGQHLAQLFILLVEFPRLVALLAQRFHLFRRIAKDEDVLFTHVLQHFDIGTVQRADGQRAVQGKLHITGA